MDEQISELSDVRTADYTNDPLFMNRASASMLAADWS
jgi:hypothetical protein